ncbi:UDP-N-acetylmuramate dehydrogenase [Acutalibacter caecimuris]|uniref:UDP-N-acetylmuramate dehydrogenase n=1 Tax=Acutalibacter caecimuris TaxID=3093657 RepID=UPI002AC8DD44|nr:UDP-N-acetylmuramate dehydrogenase [Acutalibacter sp. M00118]
MVQLDYTALDRVAAVLGCQNETGVPLAPYTTFRIGGPVDRLLTVETVCQLEGVLQAVKDNSLSLLLLGKGSNLLVGDGGYRGVALRLAGDFKRVELLADGITLRAGAGATLATACTYAREQGLSGLEFAWGIPGSVGGAVYMNAGAYGGEMKDVVVKASHYDLMEGPGAYQGEALEFAYRHSKYSGSGKAVTFTELRLMPGDPKMIGEKMEELMARRKDKQPYDMPSAGSTFKRPQGAYAAALIDQCGLRGRRVGGAQVSEKHTGFIVNTGGATCRDVLALMEVVQETVLRETGFVLEPEVRVTGEQ